MNRRRFTLLLGFCALAALAILRPPTVRSQTPEADPPRLHYTTTWIGNSFPGTVVPGLRNRKHVQISAEALFVAPDGTCYLNSNWDEDGYEAGIYRNGDVVGNCDDLHGWGRSGGKAICASDKYIYVAMSQRGDDGGNYPAKNQFGKFQYPPKDRIWRCVRRYDLMGKPAPFAGGSGHDGSMLIVADRSLLSIDPHVPPTEVTGLACSVAMNRLYVCGRRYDQQPTVTEYDAETLQPVAAQLKLTRSNDHIIQIAVGERGDLWALIARPNGESILYLFQHFGADGQPLGKSDYLDLSENSAISLDEARHRLILVDDLLDGGSDRRVSIYDIVSDVPRLTNRVGADGGISGGKGPEIGRDGPLRFNHPTGAGCDRAGNLYVACSGSVAGGGTILESYAPDVSPETWTRRNWRLMGLEFVDGGDFDPATDGRDLYTKEEHFRLDLSKPAGQDSTYFGYTITPNSIITDVPDPRIFTHPATAFFRRIGTGGAPILYTTDMYVGPLTIDRFDRAKEGEHGIPCGLIAKKPRINDDVSNSFDFNPFNRTEGGEWIWHDTNGDGQIDPDMRPDFREISSDPKPCPEGWGWCVDSRGDIWQATDRDGIRHFPCGGLDAHGSPIYTFKTMETIALPAPLTELCRAEYVPETDTMFLTGYTTDRPHKGGEWGAVGTEALRFDGWKRGNRTPNLRIPLLYDGKKQPTLFIKSFSVAGDYCFAAEGRDPERIFVYDARSGKLQGVLQPDATVGSNSGWIDHPYAIRAFRRKNGEYLVLAEEDLDAKLILYRWTPQR